LNIGGVEKVYLQEEADQRRLAGRPAVIPDAAARSDWSEGLGDRMVQVGWQVPPMT
jgi:hypothetical protein